MEFFSVADILVIVIGSKKHVFSTNLLAKLLTDSLLSESLLSESSKL